MDIGRRTAVSNLHRRSTFPRAAGSYRLAWHVVQEGRGGVLAAAAILWFLWRVFAVIRVENRRLLGPAAAVSSGVAAAGLAYLAHGLLDANASEAA